MSVALRRITPALAVAAAAALTAGLATASGASAAAPAARMVHAPLVRPASSHLVHATSGNWAGWDATGGTYTTVTASWTQPAVTCSGTAYSSFWIGLDGDGSNSVEQTGSEGDCEGGSPVYYAWYEFYPKYPVNYSNTVRPGDHFTSTVTSTGGGKYTLKLADTTQGWTQTKTGSAPDAENASAEIIAEAPSSNTGVLPLANFGSMKFTNAKVDGVAIGSTPGSQKITMASGGTTKAAVSALTSGTNFTVTWKHR